MMIDVHTEIEPPGLPDDEDDGSFDCIRLHSGLFEPDDTHRAAYSAVPPDADDDTIAAAMVETLLGVAAMRSPELLEALRHQIHTRKCRD